MYTEILKTEPFVIPGSSKIDITPVNAHNKEAAAQAKNCTAPKILLTNSFESPDNHIPVPTSGTLVSANTVSNQKCIIIKTTPPKNKDLLKPLEEISDSIFVFICFSIDILAFIFTKLSIFYYIFYKIAKK
jgi:hypothetical protein